jgi:hypothetical protein
MTYKLTSISQPADPYYGAVSLLLHGDGTNGSTTIVDNSPSPKTVTAVGNAQISTAQSKFGGSSLAFDGNGDYLILTTTSDFAFGTSDFTIEFWAYVPTAEASNLLPIFDNDYNSGGGVAVAIRQNDGFFGIAPQAGGVGFNYCVFSASFTLNTWNHFAMVSTGGAYKAFLNGSECSLTSGSTTALSISRSSGTTAIGLLIQQPSFDMGGYIDDFRITKGVARYTADFTPPTQPFISVNPRDSYYDPVSLLLKGDGANGSTTIVDSSPTTKTVTAVGNAQISTAQSKFGGASIALDGGYLLAPKSLITELGADAFTIEFWVYLNEAKDQVFFSYVWQNHNFFLINVLPSGALYCWFGHNLGGTWGVSSTTPLSTLNTWHHVAICRSGNTFTGYVNGVSVLSLSSSISLNNSTGTNLLIGEYYVGGANLNGYIDDLRITKGVARYTSNFTPPGPHPTF